MRNPYKNHPIDWSLVGIAGIFLAVCVMAFWFTLLIAQAQTVTFANEVWKSTGDPIKIVWEYPTDPRVYQFQLLRCTVGNSCSTIAIGGAATREFNIAMSSGSTKRYYLRVRVVVVEGGVQNIGPSSSEMIVNRK
jgi:hypothetical protein